MIDTVPVEHDFSRFFAQRFCIWIVLVLLVTTHFSVENATSGTVFAILVIVGVLDYE